MKAMRITAGSTKTSPIPKALSKLTHTKRC